MSFHHAQLARKIIESIGGSRRCFPIKASHVASVSSTYPPLPGEFHSKLLRLIRSAKERVYLASLYIGPAASPTATAERELLDALADLAAHRPEVEIKLLMDANRALRPVKTTQLDENTSSAEAVYKCIQARTSRDSKPCALYLFNPSPRLLLPSPLNEVAGVFHIKCYIIDDNLILSGANLSQEYFTNRQDRCAWFTNGGGGLVDFYVDLMNTLCDYGSVYCDPIKNMGNKQVLIQTLATLMTESHDRDQSVSTADNDPIIAYAMPTFQGPTLPVSNDVHVTQQLLSCAAREQCSIQLASAYLNPTRPLLQSLSNFQDVQLLTAGPKSHGFAPKVGLERKGDWVPQVFQTISENLAQQHEVLLYSRPGWTFHAKGLWVTSPRDNLVAAMVGSGNYGYRSWHRDVESNIVMVFPEQSSTLQTMLKDEWTSLCRHAELAHLKQTIEQDTDSLLSPAIIHAGLPLIQRFL
jgi:CDP-diacylglycerol---glycerol-3-phosphate 3-phosphatidyltransferase